MAYELRRLVTVVGPGVSPRTVPSTVHVVDGGAAVFGMRIRVDVDGRGVDGDDVVRDDADGCGPHLGGATGGNRPGTGNNDDSGVKRDP